MIGKLARKTAEKFVENDNIFYDKISIYQYGFFVFYSNIFFLIITSIIGAIFSAFLQSVVFYLLIKTHASLSYAWFFQTMKFSWQQDYIINCTDKSNGL